MVVKSGASAELIWRKAQQNCNSLASGDPAKSHDETHQEARFDREASFGHRLKWERSHGFAAENPVPADDSWGVSLQE
jgi:hypothetical protein